MTQLATQTDLDLGTVFSPPSYPNQLCHRQLDITIHDTPTFRHYDPEVVLLRVAPDLLGNSTIRVRHPWEGKENHHAFASTVIMRDRLDKVVEAFTFGGNLLIESKNGCTKCSLRSLAPILSFYSWCSVETELAEEVEILLAERREVWDEDHKQISFEHRLAEADPFVLYLSCLKNLQDKFSHFPNQIPEYLIRFIHFLRVEIKRLSNEGLWPLHLPQIEELL